ncbi:hypothetical protein ACGFK1_09620 [Mycobacterium sp. NPDC048908]|uniref:hypothetical protein n=1 Tax=Mycobacterium sp. NPDC048908 TaxID=3364292 RepID=UPI0037154BCE
MTAAGASAADVVVTSFTDEIFDSPAAGFFTTRVSALLGFVDLRAGAASSWDFASGSSASVSGSAVGVTSVSALGSASAVLLVSAVLSFSPRGSAGSVLMVDVGFVVDFLAGADAPAPASADAEVSDGGESESVGLAEATP